MNKILQDFIAGKTMRIEHRNVVFCPVVHYSMEFAAVVRQEIQSGDYDFIAIELPETLNPHISKAVKYLPAHIILRWSYGEDESGYLTGENTDPFWEAIRSATENNISWACIDRESNDYPAVFDPLPDTAALSSIKPSQYLSAALKRSIQTENFIRTAFADNEQVAALIQNDEIRHTSMAWHLNTRVSEGRKVLFVCGISHVNGVLNKIDGDPVVPFGRVKRENVEILRINEDLSPVISETSAFFRQKYEKWRENSVKNDLPSRYDMFSELLTFSAEKYTDEFKTTVKTSSLKLLMKYARNLAVISGNLFPEPWDIITAANGMVDHDFGFILHRSMTDESSLSKNAAALDEAEITPEDLGKSSKTIYFHRRVLQRRARMMSVVRTRPKEKFPGEWGNISDEDYICSYQPEDIVIENFGSQLADKGRTLMGDLGKRVYPFSSSIQDGIDVRETLRNWHEGRIYVEENFSGKGKVGAVVLIYDHDDGSEEKYPYRMHWLGEHNQESDMAFYATMPGENMVGPGISRCEYGGMLLSWPPLRMWPVWEDPWLQYFQKKSSILLAAALQLTQERIVVYSAASPPEPSLKRLAGRMGLKIVYLPLGTLPPDIIRRTRHFHILAGKDTRKKAPLYILDD